MCDNTQIINNFIPYSIGNFSQNLIFNNIHDIHIQKYYQQLKTKTSPLNLNLLETHIPQTPDSHITSIPI